MKALSICERYAATFDSNDKYGLLLHCAADSTAECDLLIIERLDALLDSSSDVYMVEHIYAVIDGRYKSGKPMVVTIDHDPMSLRDALQEQQQRILDRILERCYPIT